MNSFAVVIYHKFSRVDNRCIVLGQEEYYVKCHNMTPLGQIFGAQFYDSIIHEWLAHADCQGIL